MSEGGHSVAPMTSTPKREQARPLTRKRRTLAVVMMLAGLVTGALVQWAPDPAPDIPPCATEDAPGPCYWDADERGNGQGRSFTVDEHDVVTYLP